MNKTRVLFILFSLFFFGGTFSPVKRVNFTKMAKTRVLFILFVLLIWGGGKNEQNPDFVHFVIFVHSFWEHWRVLLGLFLQCSQKE